MSKQAAPALRYLGKLSRIPDAPDANTLDRAPNPHADTDYIARFAAPEFTSLCPMTGQPDFAHLVIDYTPDKWILESKSLKLYLASFRNHGAFHEDCTVRIGKDLVGLLEPRWLKSAAIGFRAGAFQSTSSGNSANCPRAPGFPIRAFRPIEDAGDQRFGGAAAATFGLSPQGSLAPAAIVRAPGRSAAGSNERTSDLL